METVIAYIVGVVVFVIGLAISIGLHELGHLFWAKRFGVRVGQWMIGFGPTLFSRSFGETEYGVKAIPLGGYISMAGMYPPKDKDTEHEPEGRAATTGFFNAVVQDAPTDPALVPLEEERHRVFYALAPWKRIIVMLGGPVMNLLIGLVCATIVICGFGAQQTSLTVGSVSACVVPQTGSSTTSDCTGKDPSPAASAGFKPGDTIVSIDGTAATSWSQATGIIQTSPGSALDVVVERNGRRRTLHVTPIANKVALTTSTGELKKNADGSTATTTVGFIGIGSELVLVPQPVTYVVPAVWSNITGVGNVILHYPQRIVDVVHAAFGGGTRDPNGPIGVVGVGRIAGDFASDSSDSVAVRAEYLINLIGSLNIALFVFNLVPLLPLDGGHVLGALWEAVRRRVAKLIRRPDPGPVDISKLIPITMVVTVILAGTSLLLVYADIVNPVRLQ